MKRLLIMSVIVLALLAGVPSIAPIAYANATDSNLSNNQLDANGNILGTSDAAALSANQTAAAKTNLDLKQKEDDTYDTIMMKIMSLFAWLVGVAAMTLDYAVFYTVVVMGSYIKGISAIGLTWEVLRDIGNIILIFGFLAIGISVILNTERLGYGKKMLPMLLVAAVFMNFSLFFAEAIIDTGNLFATQFYKQINGGELPRQLSDGTIANPAGTGSLTPSTEAISTKLMSVLGLQAIYGNASNPEEGKTLLKAGSPWYVGFLGILLFIITAFVMFSLAFILIARFVILIFLIILSPIGFAGLAVPQLASTAHRWWSTLFQQTITAPVLLLMLYIALRVITDVKFLTGLGVNNTNAITGVVELSNLPGFAGYILSFLVAMGLLIAVTITAKSLSAFGAGAAMKGAGALSFGATAWAGRNTIGWGANKAGKYLRSTRLARIPLAGTGIIKGLDKVAGGSLDIRGIKAGGGLKSLSVEAGEAHKGGYKDDLKARIESRTKYAAEIKGKEFKDLSEEDQFALAEHEKELSRLEKLKKEARNVEELRATNANIKVKQKEIEEFHKEKDTEVGNKIKYAEVLTGERVGIKPDSGFGKVVNFFNPAANTDAAKKIKEEAKKSKDDKDLESLKKMLKKVGGEEPPATPPAGGAPADGAPAGGGAAH